jgi:hypothetical protein
MNCSSARIRSLSRAADGSEPALAKKQSTPELSPSRK